MRTVRGRPHRPWHWGGPTGDRVGRDAGSRVVNLLRARRRLLGNLRRARRYGSHGLDPTATSTFGARAESTSRAVGRIRRSAERRSDRRARRSPRWLRTSSDACRLAPNLRRARRKSIRQPPAHAPLRFTRARSHRDEHFLSACRKYLPPRRPHAALRREAIRPPGASIGSMASHVERCMTPRTQPSARAQKVAPGRPPARAPEVLMTARACGRRDCGSRPLDRSPRCDPLLGCRPRFASRNRL